MPLLYILKVICIDNVIKDTNWARYFNHLCILFLVFILKIKCFVCSIKTENHFTSFSYVYLMIDLIHIKFLLYPSKTIKCCRLQDTKNNIIKHMYKIQIYFKWL